MECKVGGNYLGERGQEEGKRDDGVVGVWVHIQVDAMIISMGC